MQRETHNLACLYGRHAFVCRCPQGQQAYQSARDRGNLKRLATALLSVHARLRGAPPDVPFILEAERLRRGLNFTFLADIGPVDILGEVAGVGQYPEVVAQSVPYQLFGSEFKVPNLEKLIAAKRVAGQTKYLFVLPELEAIIEFKKQGQ